MVEDGNHPQAYVKVIWYDFALLLLSSIAVIAVRFFDAKEKGHFKVKA